MIIQFKVLVGLVLLANVVMGNLGELNSIFSTYTHPRESSTCNSIGEPFQRHTVINNIEKAMEIGLNKSFHEKYICLQKVFDEKLIEMQQAYKQSLNNQETVGSGSGSTTGEESVKPSKHQSKLQKYHGELADHFIGQTGFIFYSIDQNGTITDFKHESFKFVKPVTNLSDSSLLESELAAFNSDLFALKALSNNIKKNIRLRMNLLKAIETNERELELEQKEQEKLLNKGKETAGSDAISSKKELKKLKKLQKQKPQSDEVQAKEEKTKEKRNVESGVSEKKAEPASVTEQSQDTLTESVKKTEAQLVPAEKNKRDQKSSSSKNKNKKDKKNKSKSGKNKDKSAAKRVKSSSGKQDIKSSSQAKSSQKETPKM